VGKIAIRDDILMKPAKLTVDEFNEMKKHTFFGEKVIEKIQESAMESVFLTHAKIMAGTHHEKWDGSGYPRGIAGLDIPLQGRLMAIVDVYDALISERPYKKPFSQEQSLQIIKEGSGVHFDPALVEIFSAAIQHFPE
jgi:putative two-component system response regulator